MKRYNIIIGLIILTLLSAVLFVEVEGEPPLNERETEYEQQIIDK